MFTKRLRRSVSIVRAKGCPFETQNQLLPSVCQSIAGRTGNVLSLPSTDAANFKTPGQGFSPTPRTSCDGIFHGLTSAILKASILLCVLRFFC